ncbi:hypothetical protein TNCV_3293492 [Trichonephila clavipes]|nr:hypothetical protein TNCV_3293492 [Trichonephila clavipes]
MEFVRSTSSEMLESARCEPNTVEFPSCETNIAEPANYGINVTTSARTNIIEPGNCRTIVARSEVWIGGLSNYQNKKIKRMLKKSEASQFTCPSHHPRPPKDLKKQNVLHRCWGSGPYVFLSQETRRGC